MGSIEGTSRSMKTNRSSFRLLRYSAFKTFSHKIKKDQERLEKLKKKRLEEKKIKERQTKNPLKTGLEGANVKATFMR